jgi:hypothetical protein
LPQKHERWNKIDREMLRILVKKIGDINTGSYGNSIKIASQAEQIETEIKKAFLEIVGSLFGNWFDGANLCKNYNK